MNFQPTELTQDLALAVRSFADGAVRAAAAGWDGQGRVAANALRELRDLGVLGLNAPESLGGLEADAVTQVAVWEELAAGDPGLAMLAVQHATALAAVLTTAQPQLSRQLASGKLLATWAHAEDAAHLDVATLTTVAEPVDGGFRLTGRKLAVVAGELAQVAVVTARLEGAPTAFVVPLDAAGVTRQGLTSALGLRSAGIAEIAFVDVLVPPEARVTASVAALLDVVRLGTAAVATGAAREALRVAARYAQEREQFGKPISTLQPIQWQVANSAVELDAARLLVQRAATVLASGKSATRAIAMAKSAACEAACKVTDRALQIHGGYGYTRDYPVEKLYRDAAVLAVVHGAQPTLKVAIAQN